MLYIWRDEADEVDKVLINRFGYMRPRAGGFQRNIFSERYEDPAGKFAMESTRS